MQVTSDSLFHFTSSLRNLTNILLIKFRLSYCNETFILDKEEFDNYFPLISFCDLPLSLTKKHIYKYGCYAIGLSKEWGIKNKLNPVIYVEKNSIVANDFNNMFDSLDKLLDDYNKLKSNKIETQEKHLKRLGENAKKVTHSYLNYLRYMKNYRGKLIRNDRVIDEDYRFYDEREWRYVPALNDKRIKDYLNYDEYQKWRGSARLKPLIDNIELNFTAKDIKYLIVKSNNDIPKLIRFIKSTSNLTENPNEADILTTKILTVDQLNNDF